MNFKKLYVQKKVYGEQTDNSLLPNKDIKNVDFSDPQLF